MKRQTIGAAASVVAGLVALRRFGPSLHQEMMRTCEGMFDRMTKGPPIDQTTGDSPDAATSIPRDPARCRSTASGFAAGSDRPGVPPRSLVGVPVGDRSISGRDPCLADCPRLPPPSRPEPGGGSPSMLRGRPDAGDLRVELRASQGMVEAGSGPRTVAMIGGGQRSVPAVLTAVPAHCP